MSIRGFIVALAALLAGALLVETAQAYPTTARKGTTTVTGAYRPMDISLSLIDGLDALDYDSFTNVLSFTAKLSGTYDGVGYSATGPAGDWQLLFSTSAFANTTAGDDALNTITLSATSATGAVGTLTYLGGGDYTGVPLVDTPALGDFFEFYAPAPGDFLKVICGNGVGLCTIFDVEMLQDLTHLGPFTGSGIDLTRINPACEGSSGTNPCGSVPVSGFLMSSVPEPGSLALVGLALAVLALASRRPARR